MHRIAVRIAILALGASALGGCGMMGLDSDASSSGDQARATDYAGAPSVMSPDVAVNIRQAQALRTQGDTLGATRIISQLMLVYPDDPRVVGEYGKLLVQENRSADALAFLQRAVQLQPSDWMLYSAMGVAYDQQNDPANARLAYDRALQLKPGEPAVLNNYAMSRLNSGDANGARNLLLQAKTNGSTDPRVDTNLAMIDRMMAPAPGTAPMPAPTNAAVAVAPMAAPRKPVVAQNNLPSPAHGAPAAITRGNTQVVMQEVPVDPLAGPVAGRKPAAKSAKVAKAMKHMAAPVHVATVATTKPADKPAKKLAAKPAADHIPALRMTADANRP